LSVTGTSRQALFSATPAVILFGDVPKNSVKPDSVALTNIGDTTLFIDSVRVIGGQFSVLPNGLSALAVAGTQKYTVSFAPTSEGTQTGKVVFWHSGPSSHDTVHLIGTGTVPLFSAAPASLSFGAVLADSTKKDSVTVRNIGTAPLIISSVSSNDPELTVIPTSVTIAPSDSQKFYLTFSPLSQYFTRSDTLTFTHNATGSPARIFCSATGVGTLVDSVRAGWNMRSVPLLLGDYRRVSLFPASSSAFAYRGSYEIRDTLQNGTGYWIKFASPQTVQITGLPVARESIDVRANWNMVGSISSTIAVNTLASMPGGIVTSKFYSYSGSYVASDSIRPGHAYWVKVNQAGKLILTATPSIVPANWIRIELSPETPPDPPEAEISNLKSEIPDQFALEQNYPNPFNPVTFIRYSLPVTIHVTLKVYNTLGQEVRTLIDGAQEPGYKAAEFDASALPSGIYFYRLTAGSFSGTRKLILTK